MIDDQKAAATIALQKGVGEIWPLLTDRPLSPKSSSMNRRRLLSLLGVPVIAGAGYAGYRRVRNPYYDGPVSDHYDGLRFRVPGVTREKSLADLVRWRFGGDKQPWPERFPSPFSDKPPARVEGGDLRVSYIGHASVLLQTHGLNILIDPVWSQRASPFGFTGPKRVNDPGVALKDLPPLDAVLVSHNHYDHLDMATLSALAGNPRTRFLTPLGNDAIMRDGDAAIRAQAYDWSTRVEIGAGVFVHFEPAYHWSARGLFDRRMALWCAFVIETPSGKIYHVADTGFADGAIFRQMRDKYGGFRLAILPIGAYEPRWFMREQHINPDEAVAILQLCGAERAMAHHWGTFQLTDEAIGEPPQRLAQALLKNAIAPERFQVKRPGEVLEFAVA